MNIDFIEKILVKAAIYSICLPILTGIWNIRKTDLVQKRLLLYLPFSFFVDLFSSWLGHHKINNMPLFHFGTMVEFLFLSYLYYLILPSQLQKYMIMVTTIIYLIFSGIWLFFFADIFNFNHEARILQSIFLVMYSLIYFNSLSKEISIKTLNFKNVPMFWISLGVLLYFTGNFFLFSFYRPISTVFPEVWVLHSILNILTNILFTISFLCKTR